MAVLVIVQATFRRSDAMQAGFLASRVGYLRMGAIVLALTATTALMDVLGFQLTMLGFGFSVVGVYSLSNSVFDIGVMLGFGLLGYAFRKLDIPLAPLVLTMILGPLMERRLRQSLEMSQGDMSILFTRPLSATLLVIALLVIATSTFRALSAVKGETQV